MRFNCSSNLTWSGQIRKYNCVFFFQQIKAVVHIDIHKHHSTRVSIFQGQGQGHMTYLDTIFSIWNEVPAKFDIDVVVAFNAGRKYDAEGSVAIFDNVNVDLGTRGALDTTGNTAGSRHRGVDCDYCFFVDLDSSLITL